MYVCLRLLRPFPQHIRTLHGSQPSLILVRQLLCTLLREAVRSAVQVLLLLSLLFCQPLLCHGSVRQAWLLSHALLCTVLRQQTRHPQSCIPLFRQHSLFLCQDQIRCSYSTPYQNIYNNHMLCGSISAASICAAAASIVPLLSMTTRHALRNFSSVSWLLNISLIFSSE